MSVEINKDFVVAYHGTTRKHADLILAGNEEKDRGPWACSYDNYLYVWCPEFLLCDSDTDPDDEEWQEAEREAIESAFSNGQIACAASKEMQTEIVVIKLILPREDLEVDESCVTYDEESGEEINTMRHARCVRLPFCSSGFENHHISDFCQALLTCEHNSRLDAVWLLGVVDNVNFNTDLLSDSLLQAVRALQGAEIYLDMPWYDGYETESLEPVEGEHVLIKKNKIVFRGTSPECHGELHRLSPHSWDYSMKYGGWRIEESKRGVGLNG